MPDWLHAVLSSLPLRWPQVSRKRSQRVGRTTRLALCATLHLASQPTRRVHYCSTRTARKPE
jgi:hypothetical protein